MSDSDRDGSGEPIAIVGIGALYPGARTVEQLWDLLCGIAPVDPADSLDDLEVDLATFRIPPVQRGSMTRMQVLMLEAARRCLDDAGYSAKQPPAERTDVIAGTCFGLDRQYANALRIAGARYAHAVERAVAADLDDRVRAAAPGLAAAVRARLTARLGASPHDRVGEMASTIPARIAASFRFLGRTVTVEAADATSFVALEHAVNCLRANTSDAVLVVTGQRREGPLTEDLFAGLGAVAGVPFPVADGVAALLLKRRSTALADGDRVYAAVRECVVRREPRPGVLRYSASVDARSRVAEECHELAGVDPGTVGYLDCVGPGTQTVGTAELKALGQVFASAATGSVLLGSARSRLGHTFANAGSASIIKTALILARGIVPPQSPSAELPGTPFSFPLGHERWPAAGDSGSSLAAVCGSALGGTLSYVLLAGPETVGASTAAHVLSTADPLSGTELPILGAMSGPVPQHDAARPIDATLRPGIRGQHADSGGTFDETRERSGRTCAEPIAIVGFAGAFTGAPDAATCWRNVGSGSDSLGPLPAEVLDRDIYFAPGGITLTHSYCEVGGPVAIPDRPPGALRIVPRRYQAMDPAQRLALSVADDLLAQHGRPEAWHGRAGLVVIGSTLSLLTDRARNTERCGAVLESVAAETAEIAQLPAAARDRILAAARPLDESGPLPPMAVDGCLASGIAAHLANEYQLAAVPVAIEAACASALAAIDVAVTALRLGRIDYAIVGGVELACNPRDLVLCSALGMLSPTRITPFDATADGFSPGEGCALFVLQRLSDAHRDEARIAGLIRSVGGSNDAKSLIAPDVDGQARAMRRAFDQVEFEPGAVDYLEAHGAGTKVGDRVEISAAAKVYAETPRTRPLVVGSVKSFVGHTYAAAGGAGLLQTLQAMHAGTFPPVANLRTPNPQLPLGEIPVVLPTTATPWPTAPGRPRRAGVSSFGTGGINYHLLLEEYT